jgi:hypothetical protein
MDFAENIRGYHGLTIEISFLTKQYQRLTFLALWGAIVHGVSSRHSSGMQYEAQITNFNSSFSTSPI